MEESNRIVQRNIGALADNFSSIMSLLISSPKEDYPRNLSSLADIQVYHNRPIRSVSTEAQCSPTESFTEEDASLNDQKLCSKTDRGSIGGKGYRQDEETIYAYYNLTPPSPDICYSMRRYLMEKDEVFLFESDECTTSEREGRLDNQIDGVHHRKRRRTLSCKSSLLDRDESSGKNQKHLSSNAWKMAISAIEDFNHEVVFDEP